LLSPKNASVRECPDLFESDLFEDMSRGAIFFIDPGDGDPIPRLIGPVREPGECRSLSTPAPKLWQRKHIVNPDRARNRDSLYTPVDTEVARTHPANVGKVVIEVEAKTGFSSTKPPLHLVGRVHDLEVLCGQEVMHRQLYKLAVGRNDGLDIEVVEAIDQKVDGMVEAANCAPEGLPSQIPGTSI